MATVNHKDLADAELHQPKGIATAEHGAVLIANGTGSGNWVTLPRFSSGPTGGTSSGYLTYQIFSCSGWIGATNAKHFDTPANGQIRYIGSNTGQAFIQYSGLIKHNIGGDQSIHLTVFKNGALYSRVPQYAINATFNINYQFNIAFVDTLTNGDTYALAGMMVAGTPTITWSHCHVNAFGTALGYV